MSWRQLNSLNLLHWSCQNEKPALAPATPYDCEGAFTGCLDTSLRQKDSSAPLVAFYSSVKHLPFKWNEPYPRGAAGISIAWSVDGSTWQKYKNNPILNAEPVSLEVTGFRDPFVARWPTLTALLGDSNETRYALVAGGIRGKGPTAFLYRVSGMLGESWTYLNTLIDVSSNFRPHHKWSGDYGVNFECASFITLRSCSRDRVWDNRKQIVLAGTEGGHEKSWQQQSPRTIRSCLWMVGHLSVDTDGSPKFCREYCGLLDHGCWYAASPFHDPVADSTLVWGWIPEEDAPPDYHRIKGWNGCLGLLRELFILVIPNVCGTTFSSLDDLSCIGRTQESAESWTVETLGIRPAPVLDLLHKETLGRLCQLSLPNAHDSHRNIATASKTWELQADVALTAGCAEVGVVIHHSDEVCHKTRIYFSPRYEEIVVERHASNQDPTIDKSDDRGSHTLFVTYDPKLSERSTESLQLRIFRDGDVLEVFANDRFALATLVYSKEEASEGVSVYAIGKAESAQFSYVHLHSLQLEKLDS